MSEIESPNGALALARPILIKLRHVVEAVRRTRTRFGFWDAMPSSILRASISFFVAKAALVLQLQVEAGRVAEFSHCRWRERECHRFLDL